MIDKDRHIVTLDDGFYRDSFSRVIFLMVSIGAAVLALIALSFYLYKNKPKPVTFLVDKEMRVLSPVALNKPYLSEPDLLQWIANVLPNSFELDFNHYNEQLKEHSSYFTTDGWKMFLNQLNIYANYNNVQAYKLFVTGSPGAAPYVVRKGIIPESGRYGWWVQMPVSISYAGFKPPKNATVMWQILIVRVSTLNNLMGVAIENISQPAPAPTPSPTVLTAPEVGV
jgi:intracellular multiplication protein IcmL